MSERYTKLFSLPENQYVHGAPILIAAGALLRDNRSETTLAQLKFWNISEKTIIAVMVEVDAFDVSGAALEGVTKYPYLDLSAERDMEFGQRQAIPLPDANTRRIVARVVRVVFSDNSLWEPDGAADWLPLPEPTPIIAALPSKLAEQYRRDTTEEAVYLPEKLDGLWRCTCGALNQPEEAVCHECGISLDAQSEALNEKLLQEHLAAYETEKLETAAKAEKQSKRRNKITVIALSLIAVIAAAAVLISGAVRKNNAYQAAESFADAGQYKEAITAFEALGDYKDSREKADEIKEAAYNRAVMLLDEEQYGEAKTLFEAFGSYIRIRKSIILRFNGRRQEAKKIITPIWTKILANMRLREKPFCARTIRRENLLPQNALMKMGFRSTGLLLTMTQTAIEVKQRNIKAGIKQNRNIASSLRGIQIC